MVEKYIAKSELDSAIEELCKKYNISYGGESMGFGRELAELSDKLANADVRPERHGHWVAKEFSERGYSKSFTYTNYYCSECGRKLIGYLSPSDAPYCHCGAKMDREDGDGNGNR